METNLTNTQKDSCKQIIQSSAHNLNKKYTDSSIQKTERKIPKTPLEVNSFLQKDNSSVIFSFENFSNDSYKSRNEKEHSMMSTIKSDKRYNPSYGTIDTVSTKSFGFSRPSNTFIRRETEQGMMHCKTYFNEGDGNVENYWRPPKTQIYKNTVEENNYRLRTNRKEQAASKERISSLNTLSRSKSLDIY